MAVWMTKGRKIKSEIRNTRERDAILTKPWIKDIPVSVPILSACRAIIISGRSIFYDASSLERVEAGLLSDEFDDVSRYLPGKKHGNMAYGRRLMIEPSRIRHGESFSGQYQVVDGRVKSDPRAG